MSRGTETISSGIKPRAIYGPTRGERHLIDDTLNRGHSLAAVDVDEDGVLEVICGYNGEGTSLHLYRPEDLAHNHWRKETIDNGGLGVGQMHVVDMNGNGRLDIVASGLSTGNVKWYKNQAH